VEELEEAGFFRLRRARAVVLKTAARAAALDTVADAAALVRAQAADADAGGRATPAASALADPLRARRLAAAVPSRVDFGFAAVLGGAEPSADPALRGGDASRAAASHHAELDALHRRVRATEHGGRHEDGAPDDGGAPVGAGDAATLLRTAPPSFRGMAASAAPWTSPPLGASAESLAAWRVAHSVAEAGGPTFDARNDALLDGFAGARDTDPAAQSAARGLPGGHRGAAEALVAEAMSLAPAALLADPGFAAAVASSAGTAAEAAEALRMLSALWRRAEADSAPSPAAGPAATPGFLHTRAGAAAVVAAVSRLAAMGDVVRSLALIEDAWEEAEAGAAAAAAGAAGALPAWVVDAYGAVVTAAWEGGLAEQCVAAAEASLAAGLPLTAGAAGAALKASSCLASEGSIILDEHALQAGREGGPGEGGRGAVAAAEAWWTSAHAAELAGVVPGHDRGKRRAGEGAGEAGGRNRRGGRDEADGLGVRAALRAPGGGPFLAGVQVGGRGERAREAWAELLAGGALLRPLGGAQLWAGAVRPALLPAGGAGTADRGGGGDGLLAEQARESLWGRGLMLPDAGTAGGWAERSAAGADVRLGLGSDAVAALAAADRAADVLAALRDCFGLSDGAAQAAAARLTGPEAGRAVLGAEAAASGSDCLPAPMAGRPVLPGPGSRAASGGGSDVTAALPAEVADAAVRALASFGQVEAALSLLRSGEAGRPSAEAHEDLVRAAAALGDVTMLRGRVEAAARDGCALGPAAREGVRAAIVASARHNAPVGPAAFHAERSWRAGRAGGDASAAGTGSSLLGLVRLAPGAEGDSSWSRKARTARPVSLSGSPAGRAQGGGVGARLSEGLGRGVNAVGDGLLGVLGLGNGPPARKAPARAPAADGADGAAAAAATAGSVSAPGAAGAPAAFAQAWEGGAWARDARWGRPLLRHSVLVDGGVRSGVRAVLDAPDGPAEAAEASAGDEAGPGAAPAFRAALDTASEAGRSLMDAAEPGSGPAEPVGVVAGSVQAAMHAVLGDSGRAAATEAAPAPGHAAMGGGVSPPDASAGGPAGSAREALRDAALTASDVVSLAAEAVCSSAAALADAARDGGDPRAVADAASLLDDAWEAALLAVDEWPVPAAAHTARPHPDVLRPVPALRAALDAARGSEAGAASTPRSLASLPVSRQAPVGALPAALSFDASRLPRPPQPGPAARADAMRREHESFLRWERAAEASTGPPAVRSASEAALPSLPAAFGTGREPDPSSPWAGSSTPPAAGVHAACPVPEAAGWFPDGHVLFRSAVVAEQHSDSREWRRKRWARPLGGRKAEAMVRSDRTVRERAMRRRLRAAQAELDELFAARREALSRRRASRAQIPEAARPADDTAPRQGYEARERAAAAVEAEVQAVSDRISAVEADVEAVEADLDELKEEARAARADAWADRQTDDALFDGRAAGSDDDDEDELGGDPALSEDEGGEGRDAIDEEDDPLALLGIEVPPGAADGISAPARHSWTRVEEDVSAAMLFGVPGGSVDERRRRVIRASRRAVKHARSQRGVPSGTVRMSALGRGAHGPHEPADGRR